MIADNSTWSLRTVELNVWYPRLVGEYTVVAQVYPSGAEDLWLRSSGNWFSVIDATSVRWVGEFHAEYLEKVYEQLLAHVILSEYVEVV